MTVKLFIITGMLNFLALVSGFSQHLNMENAVNITSAPGDDLFPAWSPGAKSILFQSDRSGNWDIYQYTLSENSTQAVVTGKHDEQHPLYYQQGKSLIYDAETDEGIRLFRKDLASGRTSLLLDRPFAGRQADITATERLVYFSGFEPEENQWELYSFEFRYGNLNRLTHTPYPVRMPDVSPNEGHILYFAETGRFPSGRIMIMNWYGEDERLLVDLHATDASWGPVGLKIYFITRNEAKQWELHSCWADGSHQERILVSGSELRNPKVSPDGKFLALAVKQAEGFDIFLLPFDNY